MEKVETSCLPTGEVDICATHGQFEIRSVSFGLRKIRIRSCPACAKEHAAQEEADKVEKEHRERQARLERQLDQAGIPVLFRDRSFGNYNAASPGQVAALDKFKAFEREFDTHLKTGTVLLGMGRVGTGKSHLACACANHLIRRGYTAFFTSTARLFTKVRGTWSRSSDVSEEQLLKQFESIDLMILDEVGLQRGTDDEQRTLHEILEARRLNCKPTILLTNLDATSLTSYLGERFIDRLSESGVRVRFDWESHRRQVRDVGGLDNLGAAA
jgi:DNA replication protein DnaC